MVNGNALFDFLKEMVVATRLSIFEICMISRFLLSKVFPRLRRESVFPFEQKTCEHARFKYINTTL